MTDAATEPQVTETPAAETTEAAPAASTEKKPPTLAERREKLRAAAETVKGDRKARQRDAEALANLQRQIDAERTRAAEAARRAEDAERRSKELDAELADPLSFLHKRGIAAKDIADRVLKDGTPEAANEEIKRKLAALEESTKKDREEYERRVQEAEKRAQFEAARRELFGTFDRRKGDLPLLAKLCDSPAALEREYMSAWRAIQSDPDARRHQYSDEEILESIEAAKRAEFEAAIDTIPVDELEKHLTRRKPNAKKQEAEASPAGAPQGTESAKPSKTLTNGTHGTGKVVLPENWDKMSDKAQNAFLIDAMQRGQLV